jgi:hypothetical protein
MRMNRRVFEAIRDRLSDNLPSHVHSLLELWTWLSENFTAEAVKRADLVIVDVLEGEGFFKWYEEWGNQVRSDTAGLEVLARAVEQSAREPITAAIRSLLADLADADLLGETSVSGRLDTRVSYERLARNTGLEIFQRLSEKYNAEYADAEKLHYGRKRLIRALSLLTQA